MVVMADESGASLTTRLLAKKLNTVNNRWFELGIHLGVKHSELEVMRKTNSSDAGELMIHMLDKWLTSETSCSWSHVIQALRDINERVLANKLESHPTQITEQHSESVSGDKLFKPGRRCSSLKQSEELGMCKYDNLKTDYSDMLVMLRSYLATLNLEDVKLFLNEILRWLNFSDCNSHNEVFKHLKSRSVNMLQILPIQQIVHKFPDDDMCTCVTTYSESQEHYLSSTCIDDFDNTTPEMLALSIEMCKVQFKVTNPRSRTLKSIIKIARKVFGNWYNYLTEMNKEPGSEFVTWAISKTHVVEYVKRAKASLTYLNEHEVEAIIAEIKVSSWSPIPEARQHEEQLREKKFEQLIRENEQATREKEQATREKEQATREKEQATREKEQATREKEQLAREKEQATREKEQSAREKEIVAREKKQVEQDLQLKTEELQTANIQSQQQIEQLKQQLSVMSITEARKEQPHWVVRREEMKLTEEVLGKGSRGEVKVAKFHGLKVAAKFLNDVILSNYNLQLFSREMTIAAKIRHPNLLLFMGATREGEAVILTELMPTSLRRELQKKKMSKDNISHIAKDVACALCYLHQWRPSPIIHRDISSANVLLEPLPNGWRAKVSEIASSNFMNSIATAAPGSPVYAAPEARYPDQHSPKMDTFSYGVLLVEMCVRELPESSPVQTQLKHIKWAAIVSLVRRCTSEGPADRPSMRDIMELLASSSSITDQ